MREPSKVKVARLREKRARLGLVRVEVWVPRKAVAKLRAYAARLVRGADSAGGGRDE